MADETIENPGMPAAADASLPVYNRKRKAVWIGAGVLVLLLALLLVVPAFVDLAVFKSTYLPRIEETLHRRVDVDAVRLSLVPTPSIHLTKLKVYDSPAFPDNTLFTAEQLQLRLKFWPLLRGRFEVTEFVLEKPVINLLKQPDGSFNYSDIANKKNQIAKKPESKKKPAVAKTVEQPALPLLIPGRMRIKDGQLNLETKGQKSVKINGIDLSLEDFSTDRPFAYHAAFDYPGLKTVSLDGLLSYQEDEATLKLKDNTLKAQDLVLPVEGAISNLATVPRINLRAANDQIDAKPIFQILAVLGIAPRDTQVSGPMGILVNVTGPSDNLVTEIRGQFKDVKVRGKRALNANLNGQIFLKLPIGGASVMRRLQGDGKLVARDGELTNVNLIKKVQRASGMIGLSKNEQREVTSFKSMEAEFIIGGGFADFKRIYLVNPQMEVNGRGTMTLEQPTLDMAIETTLLSQTSARTVRGKTASYFKNSEGRVVVPLKITGPVENPTVNLDSEKMAQKGVPQSLERGLGSFFKQMFKKK